MKETFPANTTISHYRILSRIGAGGMGEVYLAEDTKLNRRVAIKFLPAEATADEKANKRLVREAQAVAALDHANICAIYEVGEADNRTFIAMQFVEGETLASMLRRKHLELKESVDIAVQIADALAEAHSRAIVHRDIKPQNLMISPRGQVKVLDFGLAKVVREQSTAQSIDETDIRLTSSGSIVGTVPYMSPEQVRGEVLDVRSDIFALGAVLYEMISGHHPFEAESAAATISAILTREALPLARYARETPAELERIVSKTLRKDREKRYQAVKEVALDLRSFREELEFKDRLDRSQFTTSGVEPGVATGSDQAYVRTIDQVSAQTGSGSSPATSLIGEIKRYTTRGTLTILALAVIATAVVYFSRGGGGDGNKKAIGSLAVLPFVNESADSSTEYLSDGITESLINSLSQISNLRVISRASVFRYKDKQADPESVGRDLKVEALLTGRVVQRGDFLSISAELVDVRNGSHLWGEQYNRKLSDILVVQEEIARQISEKLQLKLSGEEKKLLTRRYTENTEAYQLYLQGRYYQNRRTEAGLTKSIEYFEQAIVKDTNYALSYTGLADSYSYLGNHGFRAPAQASPEAKAAAVKALALDDTLAEVHTSLAYVTMNYDWNWVVSEKEYRRAIELNPGYSRAHSLYAWWLSARGRFDEGIEEMKRALELDPLSLYDNANLGWHLYMARRYDEAMRQYLKTIEMDPNQAEPRRGLGEVYLQKRMYDEALSEFRQAVTLYGGSPAAIAALGHAYAVAGNKNEAQRVLKELAELSKLKFVSSYDMAVIFAGLDDKDQAFTWLEKSLDQRDGWLAGRLKIDPRLDSVRSESRFNDLLRRVGLAEN